MKPSNTCLPHAVVGVKRAVHVITDNDVDSAQPSKKAMPDAPMEETAETPSLEIKTRSPPAGVLLRVSLLLYLVHFKE